MKLPQKTAVKTAAFFDQHFAPEKLFFAVLCGFPAFLFQRNPAVLGMEILLFFLLALLRRGRAALLSPLLIVICITFFNLFTPYGKILFRTPVFTVTQGALFQGLRRGLILVGMVYMSQFALSARLTLPGGAGKFLAEIFASFNRITEKKIDLAPSRILAAIDNRVYESYFGADSPPDSPAGETAGTAQSLKSPGTTKLGWAFLALLLALLYGALFFSKNS